MPSGFAVRIRPGERREVSDGIFGFLRAATEMNMTLAEVNKKAAARERNGRGTDARNTDEAETTR